MQTSPPRRSAAAPSAPGHPVRRNLPAIAVAFGLLVVALNLIVATRVGAGL